MADEARLGDFRVICDRSGFKCWASETVIEEGTRLRVRRDFADQRNPQDFPVKVREGGSVRNARPEGEDSYPARITPADL